MIHRLRVRIMPKLHLVMPNLNPLLYHAMLTTLRQEQVDKACEVQMALVNDAQIKLLNRKHRNTDQVTDVLSFPYQEQVPGQPLMADPGDINPATGRLLLGDIALCLPQAQRQAMEYGHKLERELAFLTVHAMLHLLGYDHEDDEGERVIMQARERTVMEALNILRTADN